MKKLYTLMFLFNWVILPQFFITNKVFADINLWDGRGEFVVSDRQEISKGFVVQEGARLTITSQGCLVTNCKKEFTNNGTIIIDGILKSCCNFCNSGKIINNKLFDNEFIFVIEDKGSFVNNSVCTNKMFGIENYGTFTNKPKATLNNYAHFTNYNVFTNAGYIVNEAEYLFIDATFKGV